MTNRIIVLTDRRTLSEKRMVVSESKYDELMAKYPRWIIFLGFTEEASRDVSSKAYVPKITTAKESKKKVSYPWRGTAPSEGALLPDSGGSSIFRQDYRIPKLELDDLLLED